MVDLTISDIDDAVLARVERRAAENGASLEEEVRRLLISVYGHVGDASPNGPSVGPTS